MQVKAKTLTSLLLLVVAMMFVGCATQIESTVTAFHQLTPAPEERTFDFRPSENQKDSIEYRSYALRIEQKLVGFGWKRFDGKRADPDYYVSFNYGIDAGNSVTDTIPVYKTDGGGTSYTSGTAMSGSGQLVSYSGTTYTQPSGHIESVPYTQTVYKRFLNVDIAVVGDTADKETRKIYEGRVKSEGSSGEIAAVLPTMIEALFKNFPGNSGKSETISMPVVK